MYYVDCNKLHGEEKYLSNLWNNEQNKKKVNAITVKFVNLYQVQD